MNKELKYYSVDDLINHNFDDKELTFILDNNLLNLSIIIEMYKYTKSKLSNKQILRIIYSDNNWFNKKCWTWEEHDNYLKIIAKIYYNLFRTSPYNSYYQANLFLSKYGFRVKDNKQNENKHFKRILNYEL